MIIHGGKVILSSLYDSCLLAYCYLHYPLSSFHPFQDQALLFTTATYCYELSGLTNSILQMRILSLGNELILSQRSCSGMDRVPMLMYPGYKLYVNPGMLQHPSSQLAWIILVKCFSQFWLLEQISIGIVASTWFWRVERSSLGCWQVRCLWRACLLVFRWLSSVSSVAE